MMKNFQIKLLFLLLPLFLHTACGDDEEMTIEDQQKVITTLTYSLVPMGTGEMVTFQLRDEDGDGNMEPTYTQGILATNTTYQGVLTLQNESVEPTENITTEIAAAATEHQFFYMLTGLDMTFEYIDTDANGNPLGIETIVTTGAASSGSFRVILRHEPDKNAQGVAGGNISNAGGQTQSDVVFETEIR